MFKNKSKKLIFRILLLMLVDAMTVFENIILGTKKDSSIFIKKE